MPIEAPLISIIVCSRDRAESLRGTLISILEASQHTATSHEVIAVDNGSSDNTAEVIKSFPSVLGLSEPTKGRSYAMRKAVEVSRGKVLLFTDDDVDVSTTWISDMARPILELEADAVPVDEVGTLAGVGGLVWHPHSMPVSGAATCVRRAARRPR